MDENQLKVIVGLIAATQMSVITLVDYLSKRGLIDKADAAMHFENSAASQPTDIANVQTISMALRQIAAGLRHDGGVDQRAIGDLLH